MKRFVEAHSGPYAQNLWNDLYNNESEQKIFLVTFSVSNTSLDTPVDLEIRLVDSGGNLVYPIFPKNIIEKNSGWDASAKVLLAPGYKIQFKANDTGSFINIYMVGIKGVN